MALLLIQLCKQEYHKTVSERELIFKGVSDISFRTPFNFDKNPYLT